MLISTIASSQVIAALQQVGHLHKELAKAHRSANDAIQAYAQSLDHADDPLALLATFPDVFEGAGVADKKGKAVSRAVPSSSCLAKQSLNFPRVDSLSDLRN